jgi:hypothetical protein
MSIDTTERERVCQRERVLAIDKHGEPFRQMQKKAAAIAAHRKLSLAMKCQVVVEDTKPQQQRENDDDNDKHTHTS